MKSYRIAIASLLLMATDPLHAQTTSRQEARVRFVTNSALTNIYKYDDDECKTGEQELGRISNYLLLMNPGPPLKKMGMPLWEFKEDAATELRVATTRRFHGMMDSTKHKRRCAIAFSIDFKAGQDYEVLYDYSGIANVSTCDVKVFLLDGTKGSVRRVLHPLVPKKNPEGCRHAFDKTRWF